MTANEPAEAPATYPSTATQRIAAVERTVSTVGPKREGRKLGTPIQRVLDMQLPVSAEGPTQSRSACQAKTVQLCGEVVRDLRTTTAAVRNAPTCRVHRGQPLAAVPQRPPDGLPGPIVTVLVVGHFIYRHRSDKVFDERMATLQARGFDWKADENS